MRYQTVLLDLDGTITDSGPGIMGGVRYALEKHGMDVPGDERLRAFIGPPLKEQFRDFCGIADEEAAEMVSSYREYYSERGIFENRVYDGVVPLLKRLKDAGITVAMATSKPEEYAVQIAEHFGIAGYFDFIGGALMDGRRTEKSEVIEYVLASCRAKDRSTVIMVGDRRYDIEGAKKAGLHSLGVLSGYGSREELESAGPDYIAATPEEIGELLCRIDQ